MRKYIALIFSFILFVTSLTGCGLIQKLNDEQQQMLDTVMNNIDMWETKDDRYANYIQLQEIGGTYNLCVGYSNEIVHPTSESISSYTSGMCHAFKIDTDKIVDAGESSMILPGEMFMWGGIGTGRTLIGNTTWYYTDEYSKKYKTMENLFINLLED